MNYEQALKWALVIREILSKFCERIEIAGSIRREKQTGIKDVEIVCISKIRPITDMFGQHAGDVSVLQEAMPGLFKVWSVKQIVRNGQFWKTFFIPDEQISHEGVKIDLFIVTPETWGTQFALKTGPAEYSKWLVTEKRLGGALPGYAKFTGSFNIEVGGKLVPMYEEEDFFKLLDIPMQRPNERKAPKQ